jgi:response regulator NasT
VDDSRVPAEHEGAREREPVQGLSILVADEDTAALRSTAAALEGLGHRVVSYAVSVREAVARIAEDDPDISVVAVHEDVEHALDLVEELTESTRGPVLAVAEGGNAGGFLPDAAARGLDAFARSEDPEELRGAIEMAVRRHARAADLTTQVTQLQSALERRAVIERAKGILMERHAVGDREAFALLRDHARNRGRKVVDVAHAVTEGHALLPPVPSRDQY